MSKSTTIKICPSCGNEFLAEVKRIKAGGGIYCSRKCSSKARSKGGRKATTARYRAGHKEKCLAYNRGYNKNYRGTVRGHLVALFNHMKERCRGGSSRSKAYAEKGIKCNFTSPDDLIDYVTNVLKVDPRGLDCHRVDNYSDYEQGNIEFLTKPEHEETHKHNKVCEVANGQ